MAGFGFSARPEGYDYSMDNWVTRAIGLLDALGIERADLVGNSFGGALALAPFAAPSGATAGADGQRGRAVRDQRRARRRVGLHPSLDNMRAILDLFAWDRTLVNNELARLRFEASIRPGFQESFAAMFPAPRQRWVDAMASTEADIRAIAHETLIIHGRDDHHPARDLAHAVALDLALAAACVRSLRTLDIQIECGALLGAWWKPTSWPKPRPKNP